MNFKKLSGPDEYDQGVNLPLQLQYAARVTARVTARVAARVNG
jgi:hypothetical protein